MNKVSSADLDTVFLGSGALSYPWYSKVDISNTRDGGWELSFAQYDIAQATEGETSEHTVSDADLLKTVRKIASKDGENVPYLGSRVRTECQTLIFKGWEETDFDADMADQVLQVAAFGKVIYG